MPKKTALYNLHLQSNAKIIDFAGFSLPINYGSQLDEHLTVRNNVGMFDVSHMVISDFNGKQSKDFLRYLLANDVIKLTNVGQALYSCMLNKTGGVIDDLIVYWMGDDKYRIISNAATRAVDLAWIQKIITNFEVKITERTELAMIAVQGKNAQKKLLSVLSETIKITQLKRFYSIEKNDWFVSRTGYTGEDGFEIISNTKNIQKIWQDLLNLGVRPCGLGARDTLRLEAGMMLYGNDLDTNHTPLESGLAWTVELDNERNFIGKDHLNKPRYKVVGLVLQDKGIMRSGADVLVNNQIIGKITSGSFSPSLNKSIAFARIKSNAITDICKIQIRSKLLSATVVDLVFLKILNK